MRAFAKTKIQLTALAPFMLALSCALCASIAFAEELDEKSAPPRRLSSPTYAIRSIQDVHSSQTPVIVRQGELDALINPDGGGACPISAALIAMQTLRSMAGQPLHPQPHYYALELFQKHSELKEGRISNDRFVNLIGWVSEEINGYDLQVDVVSAKNSIHSKSGPFWSDEDGPDLAIKGGELSILAYTVTSADGIVLGRHFVLLKELGETLVRVLNPSKPMKDYQFNVEKRDLPSGRYKRVFLESPGRLSESSLVLELNTVFKVRLVRSEAEPASASPLTVNQVKTAIDELAEQLRTEGKLTSPREWRRRGVAFGLPGLDLPESVGGSGWNAQQMLEIFRHAGRYNLNMRDVVGAAHGRPAVKMDSTIAVDALKKLVEGDAYFAVAITEEDAGTDTKSMQSRAVRDGDGFRLTGSKLWNARLRQATHVVLYTTSAAGSPDARSAFLLPIDHPGLEIVDRYAHGLTGNSFGGLKFDNMYVGSEYLIGKDGDGGNLFDEHFLYWRLMQAASAIGCGERALEIMAERIRQRHVFGGPIGRFTHLQQPIGENLTKLRMALSLAREAARLFDRGDLDAAEPLVNGIKAEGVEIALAACDAAMRAHGALGYSREVDLGDRVRDLMGLRIADGTTDVMRMTVVREKYGFDLWEMSVRGYSDGSTKTERD
ncbi:MAG: acyl-CoA dehydrogenase [Planctomycetaceae bacterium]|nr:acyl-CoA dehydrogenase [Planctomycetales bacterium]MCB9925393.1 acyl-CoA dehydrogenase [Planctomycetaceae bacterium]